VHTRCGSAKDSGLRYYSPEMSRWLNRDPIGQKAGLNEYAFLFNRPPGVYDSVGLAADISQTMGPPSNPWLLTEATDEASGVDVSTSLMSLPGVSADALLMLLGVDMGFQLGGDPVEAQIAGVTLDYPGQEFSIWDMLSSDYCSYVEFQRPIVVTEVLDSENCFWSKSFLNQRLMNVINEGLASTEPWPKTKWPSSCPAAKPICCPCDQDRGAMGVRATWNNIPMGTWQGSPLLHLIPSSCKISIDFTASVRFESTEGFCSGPTTEFTGGLVP